MHNAKVYLGARSPERAAQAIKELKEETGKEALLLRVDLENLKSVKSAAADFQRCVDQTGGLACSS